MYAAIFKIKWIYVKYSMSAGLRKFSKREKYFRCLVLKYVLTYAKCHDLAHGIEILIKID